MKINIIRKVLPFRLVMCSCSTKRASKLSYREMEAEGEAAEE